MQIESNDDLKDFFLFTQWSIEAGRFLFHCSRNASWYKEHSNAAIGIRKLALDHLIIDSIQYYSNIIWNYFRPKCVYFYSVIIEHHYYLSRTIIIPKQLLSKRLSYESVKEMNLSNHTSSFLQRSILYLSLFYRFYLHPFKWFALSFLSIDILHVRNSWINFQLENLDIFKDFGKFCNHKSMNFIASS